MKEDINKDIDILTSSQPEIYISISQIKSQLKAW
jgi:hypothetical protein